MLTIKDIYNATRVLKPVIRQTDVIRCLNLTSNCELYIKTENLQLTGSFKVRGAYYKISQLTDAEREKGIIACSAGNHAQGVALSAKIMNTKATIFIPGVAPLSKIEATKQLGAEVRLVGGVYDDAYEAATNWQKESGGVLIHPFDDYDVIAGQGTIGLELLEQLSDIDAIIVPVGGGGLISGIAFAVKELSPSIEVYGVQAAGAGSMYQSLENHERTELPTLQTFADGIAVKSPGTVTYDICSRCVDRMVTVTDDEIATAILTLMEQQKLVAEGAGAAAIAAIMFNKLPVEGKKVCAIISGGNIDVNILSRVIRRGLLTTGRLSELKIEVVDRPGQLKEITAIIAEQGANVTQVVHDSGGENTNIAGCFIHIKMETRNREHLSAVREAIQSAGYKVV